MSVARSPLYRQSCIRAYDKGACVCNMFISVGRE